MKCFSLKSQSCLADDWKNVWWPKGLTASMFTIILLSGEAQLGAFDVDSILPGVNQESIPT